MLNGVRLRVFTRDFNVVLPEVQQVIQTLVALVALLAGVISLWHQLRN